ncbi:MAG: SDR family oxidoreductase [Trueperaceae bacterium]
MSDPGSGDPRRTALVTGGGRGIGRATALRLAAMGFDLALGALEQDEVEEVASEARDVGATAFAAAVDVADSDALDRFATDAERAVGPIDVLINDAGTIHLPDDLAGATRAGWDRTLDVNARGPFLACLRLVPGMRQRGFGRVVNVASTAGLRGLPGRLSYVASKHALVGLTRALAAEIADPGVTINAVCPGAVRTRLTEGSRPDADRSGWLAPDDVAAQIAWLCGPDAARVHGAVIELADRTPGG